VKPVYDSTLEKDKALAQKLISKLSNPDKSPEEISKDFQEFQKQHDALLAGNENLRAAVWSSQSINQIAGTTSELVILAIKSSMPLVHIF
jgi:hypothetical protein